MQSLCNKIHAVLQILNDLNIDIACFQETWLSSETSTITSIIKEAGYNIEHVFRSDKRGAGVAIIWKTKFESLKQVCKTKTKNYSSLQYQCVIFNFKTKLLVISIYRLQEVPFKQFLEDLDDLINDHFNNTHSLILLGDFNVHFDNAESRDTVLLSDLTSSFGLSQLISSPTHKLGHTLDLVFLNSFEIQTSSIPPSDLAVGDHFPIQVSLNHVCKPAVCPKKRISYRNLSGINLVEFSHDLQSQLHNLDLNTSDFPSQYAKFSQITNATLEHHAPLITKTIQPRNEVPWIDSEYRKERALRRKLEREWKASVLRTGNVKGTERDAYTNQRSKCTKLAELKRSQFYRGLIQKNENDQSSLYKVVSQVLDKNKVSILPKFSEPTHLANRFNLFYTEKVNNIREKIPTIDSTANTNSSNCTFTGTPLSTFTPVTVNELKVLLKGKTIKAAYTDFLPRSIMKKVFDTLLPYICDLINLSLSTGSMEGVKEATIVPLLKKSGLDPEILKNYRPVSDIVLISKLIETVVLDRFKTHVSAHNLQCNLQHGYKPFHSTETLVLKVVDDILVGFDSNSGTVLILIDLSAAFDTVDIEKLLYILEQELGITGIALKWFKSFLIGRTQKVRICDSLSDCINVLFGVPQGSVLGPVLFNMYTRSLYDVITSCGFSTSGYADDSNARLTFSLTFQHGVITQLLPTLMHQITVWMNTFFLKLNPDKTEIMFFIPKSLSSCPTINGSIFNDGTCIRFSNTVTNLGVILDRFLTFEPHINSNVAYCYKLLKNVSSIRSLITTSQTEMLVHSVISSRLDYCNSLFYSLTNSNLNKLQKVQNAAARVVLKLRKRDSIRLELINLHWLRIRERIMFKVIVFVFKCLNEMAPVELSSLLIVDNNESCTLKYRFLNSVYGRRSFRYAAPRLWNALPISIRKLNSLDNFKSKLKYHLFNNSQEYMCTVNRYM